MSFPTTFNATCVPVQLPCTPGDRYIAPCDCTFYYLCRDAFTVIRRSCAKGTAYDHTSPNSVCDRYQNIVGGGKCSQTSPWNRCQDNHANVDLAKVERHCQVSGYFTEAPPVNRPDDSNAGAIAAIVITLLLIIVIVVLVVVYVRRKGNPIKNLKESRFWRETIMREGRDYEGEDEEGGGETQRSRRQSRRSRDEDGFDAYDDTYNEIDDDQTHEKSAAFHDRRWSEPRRSVPQDEEASVHREEGEELQGAVGGAYDNPGLEVDIRDDSPPPPASDHHEAPPSYYDDRQGEEEDATPPDSFRDQEAPPPEAATPPAYPSARSERRTSGAGHRSARQSLGHQDDMEDDGGYTGLRHNGQDEHYYELQDKSEPSLNNSFHA